MDESFQDADGTRARQSADSARLPNYESMVRWGAYSLLKVVVRGSSSDDHVRGYVTNLPALSGKTPRQMELVLGLQDMHLAPGADIYRLLDLPKPDKFEPRGYSTLVDGLRLRPGLKSDRAGYRPGWGAWQITLTEPVRAIRIASLSYDETFEPGIHPSLLGRYGRS